MRMQQPTGIVRKGADENVVEIYEQLLPQQFYIEPREPFERALECLPSNLNDVQSVRYSTLPSFHSAGKHTGEGTNKDVCSHGKVDKKADIHPTRHT